MLGKGATFLEGRAQKSPSKPALVTPCSLNGEKRKEVEEAKWIKEAEEEAQEKTEDDEEEMREKQKGEAGE